MKALISPKELRGDSFRVAQVSDQEFPVADPLFWVDCTDNVVQDLYVFNPVTSSIERDSALQIDHFTEQTTGVAEL